MKKCSPQRAIDSALRDPSSRNAVQLLQQVVNQHTNLLHSNNSYDRICARISISTSYNHLAVLSSKYADRFKYRARALRVCSEGLREFPTSGALVMAWSDSVVNWAYDSLCPSDRSRLQTNLAHAWRNCRCQAAFFGRPGGWRYVKRALRISESSCNQNQESALANLDSRLTFWTAARYAQTEDEFYERSQRAEKHLRIAHRAGASIGTLNLARFYRQTYRPIQALNTYREFSEREKRIRIVYPEAHFAGEAAIMLLHQEIDENVRARMLKWVDTLLSSAIEAGYNNARILIPLARLRYYFDDSDSGSYFLRELMPNGKLDWMEAVDVARKALAEHDTDLLHSAFALGITNGSVWNSLATFVKDVELNESLALGLYNESAQLSPGSPVVHTNIARLLMERNHDNDIPLIKRHLELAGVHSDFSFRWWRPLKNELEERLRGKKTPITGYSTKQGRESINLLYKMFLRLERDGAEEPHARGLKFQNLFLRLLRLTFGMDRSAGSLSLAGIQSDASFVHESIGYRVEIRMNLPYRNNDGVSIRYNHL